MSHRGVKCSLMSAGTAILVLASSTMSSANELRAAGSKTPVTFAYSSAWVIDTAPLTTQFYNTLVKQFDAKYPSLTLKLEPIPGTYNDIVTKLSLLFRSRSTAPDIAEMPTQVIGQFQSAGELKAINNYLKTSSWWSTFPKVVQSEGTVGGQVYAVDQGENDEFIYYDKAIFKKAGLPTNWAPKNWAQNPQCSRANKEQGSRRIPNVALPGQPLWLDWLTAGSSEPYLRHFDARYPGTPLEQVRYSEPWAPGCAHVLSRRL